MTILVRQGHPGADVTSYASYAQKVADAGKHLREDQLEWPVLVDDVDGTVHRAYGMLADPTYLIDVDGRVAFYNVITHAPTLHRAVAALVSRGGRGVVLDGSDRRPHILATIVAGWPALRRGLPQSVVDLESALPSSSLLPLLAYPFKRLLAPVALRGEPLPPAARLALGAGAALAVIGAVALGSRSRPRLRR